MKVGSKMKNTLICISAIVVLIFGGLAFYIVPFPVQKVINVSDVTYYDNKQVMDKDNAIAGYKYFLNQAETIKGKYLDEQVIKKALDNYKQDLNTDKNKWSDSDKNELSRLQTEADAITYQTDSMMADYNAKSEDVPMNIWKDKLPCTMTRAFITNANYSK